MLSLVVGLLVRHIEKADRLLDPSRNRSFGETSSTGSSMSPAGSPAGSEGLVAPERRKWSLREAAVSMVLRANADRAEELRALGEKLVANASHHLEPARDGEPTEAITDAGDSTGHQIAQVRAWAISLYRDAYQVHEAADGLYIQATPPEDVVQALEPSSRELERVLVCRPGDSWHNYGDIFRGSYPCHEVGRSPHSNSTTSSNPSLPVSAAPARCRAAWCNAPRSSWPVPRARPTSPSPHAWA